MQIPSAEFIEAAAEQLQKLPEAQLIKQCNEYLEANCAIFSKSECYSQQGQRVAPVVRLCGFSKSECYSLGLQTARVILATHPLLIKAGINPDDLL